MDPEFWLFAALGGLALAGRLRRVASPAGRTARSAVQSVVRPAQRGARTLLPLGGGPVATVVGAVGTVIGEAVGEVLDGTAAAADWATGRRPGQKRATATRQASPAMTAATTKKAGATAKRAPGATKKATPATRKAPTRTSKKG